MKNLFNAKRKRGAGKQKNKLPILYYGTFLEKPNNDKWITSRN
jgi:hypothetical protein